MQLKQIVIGIGVTLLCGGLSASQDSHRKTKWFSFIGCFKSKQSTRERNGSLPNQKEKTINTGYDTSERSKGQESQRVRKENQIVNSVTGKVIYHNILEVKRDLSASSKNRSVGTQTIQYTEV